MSEGIGIDELDRVGTLDAVAGNRSTLLDVEARELLLAVHWADLHSEETVAELVGEGGGVLPGTERVVRIGADGTPPIEEFAPAEFAAVNQIHPAAGENLICDGLDLRHRHPVAWAGIGAGRVRVWKARKVAHLTAAAGLSRDQARWVDAHVIDGYSTMAWSRFLERVEAAILEVDPVSAEARRKAAALDQFVRTGQCNEYGLKTLVAKAGAGDVIFFTAMCDRIAQILRLNGDTDPVGARRAKAIGILANPARALRLLEDYATGTLPTTDPGSDEPGSDESGSDESGSDESGSDESGSDESGSDESGSDESGSDESGSDESGSDDAEAGEPDPGRVGEGDVHPAQYDADDPAPKTRACPICRGTGYVSGDPSAFTLPLLKVDPAKLLPAATLYLHLNEDSFTRDAGGVARFEGVGPITPALAKQILGDHCNVSVVPVIDVAHQAAVDAYETPATTREALHLRNPACIFPWSTDVGRNQDSDHTVAYVSPDKDRPAGQTNLGNLGLLGGSHTG